MEAVAMQKKDNMKNSCKPWVDNGIAGMFRKSVCEPVISRAG
mgnify:CR=1 FL=1